MGWGHALPVVVAAVIVVTAVNHAGEPDQQQAPTFRAGIEIGRVTVRVLDADRRPVRNLREDDFTVYLDGVARRVVAFTTDEVGAAKRTAAWDDIAPDVASNALSNPRLVVIILDDGLIPFDPWILKTARSIATKTVEQLQAGDLAAIVFTRDNRVPQDFTDDKAKLLAAVARLDYGFNRRNRIELKYAERRSLDVLRQNIRLLRSVPELRSMIVWVTPGLPDPLEFMAPTFAGLGTLDLPQTEAGRDLHADLTRNLAMATLAGVPVYALSPLGLVADSPTIPNPGMFAGGPISAGGVSAREAFGMATMLRGLSHATGGRAVVQTNAPVDSVAGLFEENTFHYTLGYEAPGSALTDGRYHRIRVEVNRAGVTVEPGGERSFLVPKAGDIKRAPATSTHALAGLLPMGDVPLRLSAASLAEATAPGRGAVQGRLFVTVGVDLPASDATEDEINLDVRVFDAEGRRQIERRDQTSRLRMSASNVSRTHDFVVPITLAPGHYNLRVAAQSKLRSRSGSVYTSFSIPNYSASAVSMSDVVLSAEPVAGSTSGKATDLLPVRPTTRRDFEQRDSASVFARVYWGLSSSVAPAASMAATIVDRDNLQVFTRTTPLAPEAGASLPSTDYSLNLPLAALKPGEYLLTLRLSSSQAEALVRHVRFQVK
jgi:VWFA-related protein